MIQTIISSQTVFLLDDAPDWRQQVSLSAEIPSVSEIGVTSREARRPQGDTLRLTLKFDSIIKNVPAFRNGLQSLNVNKVACPFWPYRFEAGTMPAITADYYALMDDDQAPAILPSENLPFNRPAYPLLFGRLNKWPEPELLTDSLATASIEFVENDEHYLTPPASGLLATFQTKNIFPFTAEWSDSPKSGNASVDFDRQNIGQSRSSADSYYGQQSRRAVEQGFVLAQSDWLSLLRFWLTTVGNVSNFYLPSSLSEASLTANIASTDAALHVDNPSAIGINDYLLLRDGANAVPVKVTGTVGSTWTIASAVGQSFTAIQTRLESLMLARFEKTSIDIDFESPDVARLTLRFLEVPLEDQAIAGETVGTTMGPLPVYAYLYTFTVNYPGAPSTWYFTSFERNLTYGGNTYISQNFEHDDIKETATIERQNVKITSRTFAGNPLALMVPFVLEWPLMLDITEVDVSGDAASNSKVLFSGEISECESDGPYITATAKSLSWIFDRKIPRRLFQVSCNWVLFEANCGLAQGSWLWTGNVTGFNPATSVLSLDTVASSNAAALIANFFAGGYLVIGTGADTQSRMISSSTAASGSNITLTIATPFSSIPANGTVVTFYPGCDGKKSTCLSKFNNYAKFGGFPFMPVGNPSAMTSTSNNGAGGGKK